MGASLMRLRAQVHFFPCHSGVPKQFVGHAPACPTWKMRFKQWFCEIVFSPSHPHDDSFLSLRDTDGASVPPVFPFLRVISELGGSNLLLFLVFKVIHGNAMNSKRCLVITVYVSVPASSRWRLLESKCKLKVHQSPRLACASGSNG